MFPILSLLILIPFIGSVLTVVSGKRYAKWVALITATITLVLSIVLMFAFLPDSFIDFPTHTYAGDREFVAYEKYAWAESFGLNYIVGVDGLSAPLVFLTQLLVLMGLIFSWKKEERQHQFFSLILLIGLSITGVFISLDLFVFFIFWELVLIPMYFFIAIWGGPNKHYASIKFLIYTHVGSVVMLLGIFALYLNSDNIIGGGVGRTFDLVALLDAASINPTFLGLSFQAPLFIAFLFGFGVKMPMVPFHTWLPDAHVEAPTAGSVILAGLLLKMGGYGIFRISLGLLPAASEELWWLMAIFGIVSLVYAAFVCLAQTDLKRLVAYSSISHMGFVLLGAATLNTIGITGGIFQMFNHGLITAVLFMLAGSVKHATGTRDIPNLSGLAKVMPIFSFFLIVSFFASMGLPGLNGFVSEFFVFLGAYELFNSVELGKLLIIPLLGVVVTAAYYLWTLHKVTLGDLKESLKNVLDIPRHEVLPLAILVFMIIFLGLYPTPVVGVISPHAGALSGLVGGGP